MSHSDPRYGGDCYYARGHHPRSFWARYVWVGLRNRASQLSKDLGEPVTEQLVCGEPAQVDGQWRRSITVQPLPPEVVADNLERARLARVPQMVSRAQGKVALIQAGLWAQVLSFVAAIDDPLQKAVAEVALNDTSEWRRDSPFLAQAGAALGLTAEHLDDLFVAAAQVTL